MVDPVVFITGVNSALVTPRDPAYWKRLRLHVAVE